MITRNARIGDPMLRAIVIATALTAGLLALVYLTRGTRFVGLVLPLGWFLPMIDAFTFMISVSTASLSAGRYRVFRDPTSFWSAIGFAGCGIGIIFHFVTFPNLIQQGPPASDPVASSPSWAILAGFMTLSVGSILSAAARWPGRAMSRHPRPTLLATVVLGGITGVHAGMIRFREQLPVLIRTDGTLITGFAVAALGVAALSALGAYFSTRRYVRAGDPLSGYVALCEIIIISVMGIGIVHILGGFPYPRFTFWWFAQFADILLAFSVVLFGQLKEYARLFRREQEKSRQLSEGEERLRLLTNSIPQLAWTADDRGTPDFVNQRWTEFTGTTVDQVSMDAGLGLVHPDDRGRVGRKWEESVRSGREHEIEHRLRNAKTGGYEWFLTRVIPLKDGTGKPVRWFGTSTNISLINESQERLTAALAARDEFISVASHELRTPLASLSAQGQGLQRGIDRKDPRVCAPERIERLARQLNKHTLRLVRLVDDMLDVSRIQSGNVLLRLEETELCSLVEDVLDRFSSQMIEAGTVPSFTCLEKVSGNWDRFRIEQAVINLLTNAMKYGRRNPVTIRVGRRGSMAELEVRDRGIGIAKADQIRIFQRFERAIDKNEVSGLGIGLYITEEIAKMHHGRIRVESEAGKGSTFTLELPLIESPPVKAGD